MFSAHLFTFISFRDTQVSLNFKAAELENIGCLSFSTALNDTDIHLCSCMHAGHKHTTITEYCHHTFSLILPHTCNPPPNYRPTHPPTNLQQPPALPLSAVQHPLILHSLPLGLICLLPMLLSSPSTEQHYG